jgi:hypothetical protein
MGLVDVLATAGAAAGAFPALEVFGNVEPPVIPEDEPAGGNRARDARFVDAEAAGEGGGPLSLHLLLLKKREREGARARPHALAVHRTHHRTHANPHEC